MDIQEFANGLNQCLEQDASLGSGTLTLVEWNYNLFKITGFGSSKAFGRDISLISVVRIEWGCMGETLTLGGLQQLISQLPKSILDLPLHIDIPKDEIFSDIEEIDFHNISNALLMKFS